MGRRKHVAGPDPRYASPIRIAVETRYGRAAGVALAAVSVACAAALGALLALVVYFTWVVSGDLRPSAELHPVHPLPQPTQSYDGRGFVAPEKETLIIQQNPKCWNGIPGQTCDEGTRTYLGQ